MNDSEPISKADRISDLDLPFLTADLSGIGGELKQTPDDFEVEEIPAYLPSGTGTHLFLWIEKSGVASDQLIRHLSRQLRIAPEQIGMAGMKDRWGTTRQYVSVSASCEERLRAIDTDRIRVLNSARHENKLRTGHLRGNRFSILLRGVSEGAQSQAEAIAERIKQQGFPNYFGTQRFGYANETTQLGLELLRGKKNPDDIPAPRRKFLTRLALSAAQSALFNDSLAARIREGSVHRILPGEVMQVVESGGMFVAEDLEAEQQRFDRREIVNTGPMFGPKMKRPGEESANRESRLLEAWGLRAEDFTRHIKLTQGTRRAYLIWPEDLSFTVEPQGMRFRFSLPTGSYATVLLREFRKSSDGSGEVEVSSDETPFPST